MPFRSCIDRAVTLLTLPLVFGAVLIASLPISSSAAPPPAPGAGGDPVYVFGLSQVGLPGQNYAPILEEMLTTELAKKFSCTDLMNRNDIASMIGLARMQQLLGTPEEQQIQLQDIAAALGSAGTLVFGSFGKAGNTYYVNIKTANLRTATVTSNQMFTATGADDSVLLDLIKQAVSQSELKPCRPKWTGTVTVTEKWDYSLQKPGYMPLVQNATRNTRALAVTYTEHSDEVRLSIPPLAGALVDANKVEANVDHTIQEHGFIYNLGTQDVSCSRWGAQLRGEYEWQPRIYETNTSWNVEERKRAEGNLTVNVDPSGHYRITWTVPSITYKRVQRSFKRAHPSPCEGPQNSESPPIEPELKTSPRTITIEGNVDPAKPDELSGEKTDNTPEWEDPMGGKNSGSTTMKWRLTATK